MPRYGAPGSRAAATPLAQRLTMPAANASLTRRPVRERIRILLSPERESGPWLITRRLDGPNRLKISVHRRTDDSRASEGQRQSARSHIEAIIQLSHAE